MNYFKSKIPIIHIECDDQHNENNNNSSITNGEDSIINEKVSNKNKVLNNLYCLFCCMIGIVFLTLEPFKACGSCGGQVGIAVDSFLIYMYFVSITWLLYMFIDISVAKRGHKISIKNHDGFNRRLSVFIKSKDSLFGPKFANNNKREEDEEESSHLKVPSKQLRFKLNEESTFKYTYDYDNGSGELYMRVGTGILSLCAMVDSGLNLIKYIEAYRKGSSKVIECMPSFTISVISEMCALIFTFIQCFFIFKHANIVINKQKNLSSFGLCHLVCTNLCITLRNIVQETVHEIHSHEIHNSKQKYASLNVTTKLISSSFNITNKKYNYMISKVYPIGCNDLNKLDQYNAKGVQATYDKIAPYLFPCIIEFSLLCLTVFYIMWENLDKYSYHSDSLKLDNEERLSFQSNDDKTKIKSFKRRMSKLGEQRSVVNNFVVDCNKSATGLFFGIFFLLITIIALIVYFIYKHENEYLAAQICEITELILIVISGVVVIIAFLKLKRFGYLNEKMVTNYNQTLLMIALIGIYLFSFFSIVAICAKGIHSYTDTLSLVIHILSLLEGTVQCAFILDGLRRCAEDLKTKKEKPARSLITLLIMTNLCLWLTETFSVKKYDMNTIQLEYYNIIFWSIATSIATPLAIFFRFHSSVCLSDIWKTLYQ
jgi:hypothetical protein